VRYIDAATWTLPPLFNHAMDQAPVMALYQPATPPHWPVLPFNGGGSVHANLANDVALTPGPPGAVPPTAFPANAANIPWKRVLAIMLHIASTSWHPLAFKYPGGVVAAMTAAEHIQLHGEVRTIVILLLASAWPRFTAAGQSATAIVLGTLLAGVPAATTVVGVGGWLTAAFNCLTQNLNDATKANVKVKNSMESLYYAMVHRHIPDLDVNPRASFSGMPWYNVPRTSLVPPLPPPLQPPNNDFHQLSTSSDRGTATVLAGYVVSMNGFMSAWMVHAGII